MEAETKYITLKDNRKLAYAEYGDPLGRPVFFFHCIPGSRLFCPSREVTRKAGVRLVIPDRPGSGLSDFQPGRRILDWPTDVAALADSLGVDRFAVVGHSGGGSYVAACAHQFPQRITAAAILSGIAPPETPHATRGMTSLNKLGFTFGRFIPWPVWLAVIQLLYRQGLKDPEGVLDWSASQRPPADTALLANPEIREVCLHAGMEAFRQGMRAHAWETRLVVRPWGFRLDEITIPVSLWHGTADREVSITMGRYVASQIPGCHAEFCDGEGHLLLFPHWQEILTQLMAY